ncbi:hypothetical protein OUZ56_005571 [Daphnia magna]|uniref:Uncharacterized protein n=1 Tax=Daphnia magna TaxID=35525 RepID=A0ABQ9YT87_9CRUS|nr:hypothetical protein OUZ56_005571 [Daphnia magna]
MKKIRKKNKRRLDEEPESGEGGGNRVTRSSLDSSTSRKAGNSQSLPPASRCKRWLPTSAHTYKEPTACRDTRLTARMGKDIQNGGVYKRSTSTRGRQMGPMKTTFEKPFDGLHPSSDTKCYKYAKGSQFTQGSFFKDLREASQLQAKPTLNVLSDVGPNPDSPL